MYRGVMRLSSMLGNAVMRRGQSGLNRPRYRGPACSRRAQGCKAPSHRPQRQPDGGRSQALVAPCPPRRGAIGAMAPFSAAGTHRVTASSGAAEPAGRKPSWNASILGACCQCGRALPRCVGAPASAGPRSERDERVAAHVRLSASQLEGATLALGSGYNSPQGSPAVRVLQRRLVLAGDSPDLSTACTAH